MAFLKISGLALAVLLGLSLPIGQQAKAMPANGLAATIKQTPKSVENVAWVCGPYRCRSTGWSWRRPYANWGWRRPLYAYAGPYAGWRRPLYAYARPYMGWRRPLYAYAGPYMGWRRPLYAYARPYMGWRRPLYAYARPYMAWRRPLYAYAGGVPYWGWRRPLYGAAITTGIGFNPWYAGGFNPSYGGAPYAYAGWNTGWRGWGLNYW